MFSPRSLHVLSTFSECVLPKITGYVVFHEGAMCDCHAGDIQARGEMSSVLTLASHYLDGFFVMIGAASYKCFLHG